MHNYSLFHCHSYYSILDGFGSPDQNAKRASEIGVSALSISDHGSVSGHMEHLKACEKHGVKPILGNELYISHKPACIKNTDSRSYSHFVVWAKNLEGWHDLARLSSQTAKKEYFYYKPRIHLFDYTDEDGKLWPGLESFLNGNIMGFSGHQGSLLSDCLFCDLEGEQKERKIDLKRAYAQYKGVDSEHYRQFLKEDWLESTCAFALRLEGIFGKGNFYIELQNELNPKDQLALWIHPLIIECLRKVSEVTGIPAMASSDPHYSYPEQSIDQRAMLMVALRETESTVKAKLSSDDGTDVMVFFGSDEFYMHSIEDMQKKFTAEELEMTNTVADMIEVYSLKHNPYVPTLEIPDVDVSFEACKTKEDRYLYHLCIEGAKHIQPWTRSTYTKIDYWERLQHELTIIFTMGLSGYFLVVSDYCNAARYRPADHSFDWETNLKNKGELDPIPMALGRGSGASCLAGYFVGITGIDPLEYDLIFSRFLNYGRMSKDKISLPDYDTDFSINGRDWVIEYLKYKYGEDNVAPIITFQRMQGKNAIKDLCRIHEVEGGFDLSNRICTHIPSEAEVAGEIQEAIEAGNPSYGVLSWCLDNVAEIQEYYKDPKLKVIFDQALRCEGIKKTSGRHPSGFIATPRPTTECFPLAYDARNKSAIIGVDMSEAEEMGGIKLDLLSVQVLDKLQLVQDLINE